MRGSNDIIQAIEEIDEDGEVKAICCLMVEKRFGDMALTPEVQKFAYMQDACVRVDLTRDFAVVDLIFRSNTDYDYLWALELCREFTALTDACEVSEKRDSDPSLILYVTLKGEDDFFVIGMDAAWGFILERPEGICNAIRLIFVREKFGTWRFKYPASQINTSDLVGGI